MAEAIIATKTTTEMVQGAGEAAKQTEELTKQTALDIAARAEEVRQRNLPVYDYEKVFFNSAYSVGLYGLAFLAVKLGGALMTIVNVLNDNGLTGWAVDDKAVAEMNKVGSVIAHIDRYMTASIPAAPVAIVAAHAGLEYVRKRKFMDKNSKLAGDVTVALAGGMAGISLFQGIVQDPWVYQSTYRKFKIYYNKDASTDKNYKAELNVPVSGVPVGGVTLINGQAAPDTPEDYIINDIDIYWRTRTDLKPEDIPPIPYSGGGGGAR